MCRAYCRIASKALTCEGLLPGDAVLVPREAPSRIAGAQIVDILMVMPHALKLGLIGGQVGQSIGYFNSSTISDLKNKGNGIYAYQGLIPERTTGFR